MYYKLLIIAHYLYYKLLAETMHDVNNDVIPSQLKDLFIPTAKIHSYNTRSSVSNNFYIKDVRATGLNNVCACAQLWRAKIGHDNNSIENGGFFKIL